MLKSKTLVSGTKNYLLSFSRSHDNSQKYVESHGCISSQRTRHLKKNKKKLSLFSCSVYITECMSGVIVIRAYNGSGMTSSNSIQFFSLLWAKVVIHHSFHYLGCNTAANVSLVSIGKQTRRKIVLYLEHFGREVNGLTTQKDCFLIKPQQYHLVWWGCRYITWKPTRKILTKDFYKNQPVKMDASGKDKSNCEKSRFHKGRRRHSLPEKLDLVLVEI